MTNTNGADVRLQNADVRIRLIFSAGVTESPIHWHKYEMSGKTYWYRGGALYSLSSDYKRSHSEGCCFLWCQQLFSILIYKRPATSAVYKYLFYLVSVSLRVSFNSSHMDRAQLKYDILYAFWHTWSKNKYSSITDAHALGDNTSWCAWLEYLVVENQDV